MKRSFKTPLSLLTLSLALSACDGDDNSTQVTPVAGTEVAGTEVAGTQVAGTQVAGTEVAGTQVAGTQVAGTQVAGTQVAGTQVAGTEVAGTEVAGTEVAGTEVAGTEVAGTEVAGTEVAGAEVAGTEVAGAEVAGAEVAGAEVAGAEVAGVEAGTEPVFNPELPCEGLSDSPSPAQLCDRFAECFVGACPERLVSAQGVQDACLNELSPNDAVTFCSFSCADLVTLSGACDEPTPPAAEFCADLAQPNDMTQACEAMSTCLNTQCPEASDTFAQLCLDFADGICDEDLTCVELGEILCP